jgi:excisionase family DNA binding protein
MSERRLDEPSEFLTQRDAAAALRLSPRTVARMVRSGALPAYKLPTGTVRIARRELRDTIATWRSC